MKRNKLIWGLIIILVLITIAVSFGTKSGYSQKENSKEQNTNGYEDVSKYPVVEFNSPESADAVEREKRKVKNKRYDNKGLVLKRPHPDDGGVGVTDESIPPPNIPFAESHLIIIGEILDVKAYLSNDKRGIYSEYNVRVKKILKEDSSSKEILEKEIITDRAGGSVLYPNGQKVVYMVTGKNLPRIGSEYMLFLTTDKQSPNYEILTGYELKGDKIYPLDTGGRFDDLRDTNRLNFVEDVKNKISKSLQTIKN